MLGMADRPWNPELRELVVEASLALARLDADRLEELAVSCQALNRDLAPAQFAGTDRAALARQAREASEEMAIFGRVLEATRANLDVMRRLRERRSGRVEYGQAPADHTFECEPWLPAENRNGND